MTGLARPESAGTPAAQATAWSVIRAGLFALLLALIVASALTTLGAGWGRSLGEEAAVARVAVILVALGLLALLTCLLVLRHSRTPAGFALAVVATASVTLCATYLYAVWDAVRFPADILLWSEGDFVSDIVKLRIGYPLYSAPANLDSFTYAPGSQILTGLLARLLGAPGSVPAYRAIQLGYLALAALFAALACRRIVLLTRGESSPLRGGTWGVIWVCALFLIGGNQVTSPFAYLLHNDALSLLVSALGYWLLVEWVATGRAGLLVAMAVLPGLGFLVKQSLMVWAGIYSLYFLLWGRSVGWPRLVVFVLACFGGVTLAIGACYLAWGGDFLYWTFTVMGKHGVSPLRSVQHALDGWMYFGIGLAGGMALLDWRRPDRLTGLWLVAVGLLAVEAYTSGIAWMLNHMGPGSMLCGVWLLAALPAGWGWLERATEPWGLMSWGRAAAAAVTLVLLQNGLGLLRIPTPVLPPDARRYAREIEAQFEGQPPERVLLDYGSWVYARHDVVSKDHAAPIGEAGYTETADFSGMLERVRTRYYRRILVRDYAGPEFTYDYYLWPRSSGIRAALEANYRVAGRIEAVRSRTPNPPWFKEITILEPREP